MCLGVGLLLVVLTNNRAVNQLQSQIARYEVEITREEEKIHNLRTEIVHLSHPERIARFAKEYLPELAETNVNALYVPENTGGGIVWQNDGKKIPSIKLFTDFEKELKEQVQDE